MVKKGQLEGGAFTGRKRQLTRKLGRDKTTMKNLIRDISSYTTEKTKAHARAVEDHLVSLGLEDGYLRTTTNEFTYYLSSCGYRFDSEENRKVLRELRWQARNKGQSIRDLENEIRDNIKRKYDVWVEVDFLRAEITGW